jgi:hypothetical protein
MNTTRIINQKPQLDIDPIDLLSTNVFVPSNEQTEDLSDYQKESFRTYLENTRKDKQIKEAISLTNGGEDYDYFASVANNNINNGTTIKKQKKHIIKILKPSIIDIDTKNRDKNLYPYPSSFTLPLGKTFYNIKSIELVSTAIPNTDQVITNTPIQIRNNRITWQNEEDKDIGRYLSKSVTSVGDYLYINIASHGLSSQILEERFYINISKSTSTPNIDGKRFAEIYDENTLKIHFVGGITGSAIADIDTGIPNYTVELTPGNYNATTIATEIQTKMNLIKRRNNTGSIFHYFTVHVNLDTDVMTFRSYITKQLSGNPLTTTSGSGVVTVSSISHGFKSGDYVLIIGAKTTGGITSSILNGLFVLDVINSDSFTYEVNERASETSVGGGTTLKTGEPSEFRIIFDTSDSLIVNNIGFPDEDSSELLGISSQPLTTKALSITNAVIVGNYVEFTSNLHGLEQATILVITNVTVGQVPILTTSVTHGLEDLDYVYISYPFTTPILEGFYPITATGNNTFKLDTVEILQNTGGVGVLKKGGDTVKLIDFNSVPTINGNVYQVENITSNTFQIKSTLQQIGSIQNTVVGTTQIKVNHPGHKFNMITSIAPDTATTAVVTTKVPHGLTGNRITGATKISTILNTVDITCPSPHLLETSDKVFISDSVNGADISGTYFIQTVTSTVFRIFFVGGTDIGTCSVNIGDSVIFTDTNSVPSLSSNNFGIPLFYIEYLTTNTFKIQTGFPITTPGTKGIIGRDNHVHIHRTTASEPGGSTLGGIPLIAINHSRHNIYDIVDENNYLIRVKEYSTFTSSSGGSNVVVSSNVHGNRVFQSNTFDGSDTGVLYKSISLEGENYIYLTSTGLQTVYAPGNEVVGEIFSRIVLSEPPGSMMFNTFVSVPKEFNPPLGSLKDISFEMKRSDGILFNFNDIDYSMSLRIVEITDRIMDTEISATTGTSDLY